MKKKGFIPIETNWFDRLFIGVISFVALQLFWMRFLENILSINFAIGIGYSLVNICYLERIENESFSTRETIRIKLA